MNMLPKVLFINHSVRDGGPGRSLYYILKYIDKTKVKPYVLIPKHDVFSDLLGNAGLADNIIIEPRFPENILRPRFEEDKQFRENGGSRLYRGTLKAISVTLNVIDLVSLILTSPFSKTFRDADIIYCNGTLAKITGSLIGLFTRRQVVWHVRNVQETKSLWATINFLSLLPAVKKIICVSTAAANQFRYSKDKIMVINNGIDTDEYDPRRSVGTLRREYGIKRGTVIVGSIGRIVPRKGYEFLIKAANAVSRELGGRNPGVKFVVVGDTPHFFRSDHLYHIKGLVRKYGLDDYFIFTGYKTDIRPYLKDFDIFVIPSNYPDPFPRTVIEAMSFAIPVVGFRVGGIVESVANHETGLLCDPGNTADMGKNISDLVIDKALRKEMGVAGRKRAIELFSAEERSKEIEKNILDLLETTERN
jgi:glycosyltransferase involved in cell wall biosynthesis